MIVCEVSKYCMNRSHLFCICFCGAHSCKTGNYLHNWFNHFRHLSSKAAKHFLVSASQMWRFTVFFLSHMDKRSIIFGSLTSGQTKDIWRRRNFFTFSLHFIDHHSLSSLCGFPKCSPCQKNKSLGGLFSFICIHWKREGNSKQFVTLCITQFNSSPTGLCGCITSGTKTWWWYC